MNRRSFLGWLGLSSLAVYSVQDESPSTEMTVETDTGQPLSMGHSSWVIKNEGDKPMVVHYRREGPTEWVYQDGTRVERIDRGALVPKFGKFADGRSTEALLLPGEELTITAVEMKL